MPIQLPSSERTIIKNILAKYIPTVACYVFGSRVKGKAKRYSDLDIVLKDKQPIPLLILSNLEESFADSDLPFMVDIVDWQRINPEFQAVIEENCEKL
jgi:predicted nucleotidyltransferase